MRERQVAGEAERRGEKRREQNEDLQAEAADGGEFSDVRTGVKRAKKSERNLPESSKGD